MPEGSPVPRRPTAKGGKSATLYKPLDGAGAGPKPVDELRAEALAAYERLDVPAWRRSGFWNTNFRQLRLEELEPRRYEPGEVPDVVAEAIAGEDLAGLIVQRGAGVV